MTIQYQVSSSGPLVRFFCTKSKSVPRGWKSSIAKSKFYPFLNVMHGFVMSGRI